MSTSGPQTVQHDRNVILTPLPNVCAWGMCQNHRMRPGGGRMCAEHELLYIAEYGERSKLLPQEREWDLDNPLVKLSLERERAVGTHETG